ncbi:MAG: NifB/NifX family molybdenum-iron cluster-binding protein [Promethearchaeota archaeon]
MEIEKVAVPAETGQGLESPISGHFGQAPIFVLSTINDGKIEDVEIFDNKSHSGCGGLIDTLAGKGVQVLITLGLGRRPYMMAQQAGIPVVRAIGLTVNEAIENYMKGRASLVRDNELCAGGGSH